MGSLGEKAQGLVLFRNWGVVCGSFRQTCDFGYLEYNEERSRVIIFYIHRLNVRSKFRIDVNITRPKAITDIDI